MQFNFGQNWKEFAAAALTTERVSQAREDFSSLFGSEAIAQKSFLDIGFGQGLSLLIAHEQGGDVVGCDINPLCLDALSKTAEHFPNTNYQKLPIIIGSILDENVMQQLRLVSPAGNGKFNIVHSWGVLHHTGHMEQAVRNATELVDEDGIFAVAIYNTHWTSPIWRVIKYAYCLSPQLLKSAMIWLFLPIIWLAKLFATRRSPTRQERGMDFYFDVIDWIGGYPYEYESIEGMKSRMNSLGYDLLHVIPATVPTGCNQFLFRRRRQSK